jgi:hypothetical protein
MSPPKQHIPDLNIAEVTQVVREALAQSPKLCDSLHADLSVDWTSRIILHRIAIAPNQTVLTVADSAALPAVDVQLKVDMLKRDDFVGLIWSPEVAHTPCLELTKKGATAWREMRRREKTLVAEIAKDVERCPQNERIEHVNLILSKITCELSQSAA